MDYKVVGPNNKIVLDGTKERQGDFVFTANDVGEYRFCFDNEMSTVTDKMVDFEISVCRPCFRRLVLALPLMQRKMRSYRHTDLVSTANLAYPLARSRTKPAHPYPAARAHPPSRPPSSPNPSTSCPASSAALHACRSTFALARTAISALYGAPSRGYSGSACWRTWSWSAWRGCRCSS